MKSSYESGVVLAYLTIQKQNLWRIYEDIEFMEKISVYWKF